MLGRLFFRNPKFKYYKIQNKFQIQNPKALSLSRFEFWILDLFWILNFEF